MMESRKAVTAVVFALVLVSSCKRESASGESAPSPSSSYELTESELRRTIVAAESGDVDAMLALENYYLTFKDDDPKGWYWMEKRAETGDLNARKMILYHYSKSDVADERKYGEDLRKKWRFVGNVDE